jgi:hypothetical protein
MRSRIGTHGSGTCRPRNFLSRIHRSGTHCHGTSAKVSTSCVQEQARWGTVSASQQALIYSNPIGWQELQKVMEELLLCWLSSIFAFQKVQEDWFQQFFFTVQQRKYCRIYGQRYCSVIVDIYSPNMLFSNLIPV